MQMHINHLYTAIYALKEDIDALYEYMRVHKKYIMFGRIRIYQNGFFRNHSF